YFDTMRLPIVRGRDVSATDTRQSPGVVLINEEIAKRLWPGEDPLGKRISLDDKDGMPVWLTIIGIVKNAKQGDWAAPIFMEVYLAALQNRGFLGETMAHTAYLTVVVRSSGDQAANIAAVKEAVWSFDRDLTISEVVTMEGVVRDANAQARFETLLLAVFAGVALALAAVGIYGVMSYAVSRRTQEIGIRLALGAGRGEVLRLVVRQGMVVAAIGLAIGIGGSLLLTRLMKTLLYNVEPTDPITFGLVPLVLGLGALLACRIPGRRGGAGGRIGRARHGWRGVGGGVVWGGALRVRGGSCRMNWLGG